MKYDSKSRKNVLRSPKRERGREGERGRKRRERGGVDMRYSISTQLLVSRRLRLGL
jgi:hypothetical protein